VQIKGITMPSQVLLWSVFGVLILGMLILDLGVFNRRAHEISIREALRQTALWLALAAVFNIGVYFWYGSEKALLFLTGYLVEESLSVDNLFVFLLIFSYFAVPARYQHKVLFWGILGAVVMRGAFITVGVTLIHRFHWIIYVFGAFLVLTGIRLLRDKEKEIHPERNPVIRLVRRLMPVAAEYQGDRFFIRQGARRLATPLLIVLLVVETTDIVFAVDSIPAILAITTDPLIVFTSNIFAILGLRSLFFALAGFMRMFRYLNYGLSVVLVFIGVKMLTSEVWRIPVAAALGVIAGVLSLSVVASIVLDPDRRGPRRKKA
jgi:tellurite resistance protein TerC